MTKQIIIKRKNCRNLTLRQFILIEFERARIKLIIFAFLLYKLFMRTALYDFSVFENHDRIGISYGGKPVSDDEHRPALHQFIHSVLNKSFRPRIDGRSSLVENKHGAPRNHSPRDGQKLSLPLRQICSVAREKRIVPFGQMPYKVIRIGEFSGFDAFFVGSVQSSVTDIVYYRSGEQMSILKHYAEGTPQILLIYLFDIQSVVSYASGLYIVESVYKMVIVVFILRPLDAHKSDLLTGVLHKGLCF